jgi:hypothetical protein
MPLFGSGELPLLNSCHGMTDLETTHGSGWRDGNRIGPPLWIVCLVTFGIVSAIGKDGSEEVNRNAHGIFTDVVGRGWWPDWAAIAEKLVMIYGRQ